MRLGNRIAFAVLFLSLARFTVPGLAVAVREAIALWPMSVDERRAEMFGPFYDGIRTIDRSVPDEEPLALVAGNDPGPALFANYYLYPQRIAWYPAFILYRADHNATRGLVQLDGQPRLISYEEARAAQMGTTHIVRQLDVPDETRQSFVVPLASSGDGRPPDVWTTEAAIVNAGSDVANVQVRMEPSGRTASISLEPGEKRTWNDFVVQLFSKMDSGWLRLESDQPLRARFWFVNRATGDADVIPFAEMARHFTIPHRQESLIWLLNPHDRRLPVRLSGGEHFLPPRSVVAIQWPVQLDATSDAELYVYQSWRGPKGETYFHWPGES